MFENVQPAPPDAILGLSEAFRNDPNPNKINLTVGVYKDATGQTPILNCVKEAERRLLENESTKSYLGIDGLPEFGTRIRDLIFAADHEITTNGRAVTVQAPGGTGALRVAGDFIKTISPQATVWSSDPTWPNHPKVFAAANLQTANYAYLNSAGTTLEFDKLLESLKQIPAGDVACLHGCCHNPSGIDPTREQWKQIADVIYERGILPLLDFAYQGFGDGIEEDAAGLREFCRAGSEFLAASSYSKNFGLYRERVGALTVVTANSDSAATVLSQLKAKVRANYSNPPAHGGQIVAEILGDAELRAGWVEELTAMRERINGMRQLFVDKMQENAPQRDFSHLARGRGMFAFSGLTAEQVDQLREKHGIYAVRNGRINIGGTSEDNMDDLCTAIASVL